MKSPTKGPIGLERHDTDEGAITYEIWDFNADTYHRICTISDEDNRFAKHDAELIVRALNGLLFGV